MPVHRSETTQRDGTLVLLQALAKHRAFCHRWRNLLLATALLAGCTSGAPDNPTVTTPTSTSTSQAAEPSEVDDPSADEAEGAWPITYASEDRIAATSFDAEPVSVCFTLQSWDGADFQSADWFGGLKLDGSNQIFLRKAPPSEWECAGAEIELDGQSFEVEATIPDDVPTGFWKLCDWEDERCTGAFQVTPP